MSDKFKKPTNPKDESSARFKKSAGPPPRPTAGGGVSSSFVGSRGTEAVGDVSARLDGLRSRLSRLQTSLSLADAQSDLHGIETTLSLLPVEVEKLRARGYVFRSFLENKIGVLTNQWKETRERVSQEASRLARQLELDSNVAENALRQAAVGGSALIAQAESAIGMLESKVSAAQSALRAMYDALRQNVDQTKAQVEQIGWLLDQVDGASFSLRPAEDPVMACRAQYLERGDKDGPEGVLYLTDQRVIFERKEEVATKKVLFIATEKEKVQDVIFDVPIGQIQEVKSSQKGLLGHKEMLELLFAPDAALSGVTLRLKEGADNEEWAAMIGRVKSGEIDKERTKPKDQAAVEAARSAPTKCPTCGATLSAQIVRGMQEITCEYCGSVIRL